MIYAIIHCFPMCSLIIYIVIVLVFSPIAHACSRVIEGILKTFMATYSRITIIPTNGIMLIKSHVGAVAFNAIEIAVSQESSLWPWALLVENGKVSPYSIQWRN